MVSASIWAKRLELEENSYNSSSKNNSEIPKMSMIEISSTVTWGTQISSTYDISGKLLIGVKENMQTKLSHDNIIINGDQGNKYWHCCLDMAELQNIILLIYSGE